MKIKSNAFTIVELIVVITILAVLATIGFVSFGWYLSWTRDTNRISQLKSMADALELYRTQKDLPIPDDKIDIKAWTGSNERTIAYQWDIWANVLETIEYTEKGLDPKDKVYFGYYLIRDKRYFQLLAFLEEPSEYELASATLWNKAWAVDYSWRYPRVQWRRLWILTDDENTPINKVPSIVSSGAINIETTTEPLIGHVDNESQYSESEHLATVASLGWILSSCKAYLDRHPTELAWKDWYYLLFSKDWEIFPTYCDMTLDWWWWTLLLKADWSNSTFQYTSNYWLNDEVLNEYSTDLDWIEYKSRLFSTMKFQEINVVIDTAGTINNQSLPFVSNSLRETFNKWYQDFPALTKPIWMNLVPWSAMQPHCNKWWINVDVWNKKVRIGFTSNNENECWTNDSVIWIGLRTWQNQFSTVWNNCTSTQCTTAAGTVIWETAVQSIWYIYVR